MRLFFINQGGLLYWGVDVLDINSIFPQINVHAILAASVPLPLVEAGIELTHYSTEVDFANAVRPCGHATTTATKTAENVCKPVQHQTASEEKKNVRRKARSELDNR